MNKEEKIAWLRNATVTELLQQYEHSVNRIGKGTIYEQLQAQEDMELAREEVIRRIK